MRISFDLDDTLICYDAAVPCEPPVHWLFRRWYREPLRRGTVELLTELRRQGHELWIFTTSYRSFGYVRRFFRLHGLRIDGVVNQAEYERIKPLASNPGRPSKNPRLFSIDLHIDDSEGVRMEGDRFGFRDLVVRPEQNDWTRRVLDALNSPTARVTPPASSAQLPDVFE